MKYLYIFALVFCSTFCLVYAETVNITNLVFTTEQKNIPTGEISEAITVQAQNSSGSAEKVDETNDVTFSSSSATGEFLNSTGNAVSTTMAKNTSSRTFYYRDSISGTHTLTVTINGRDTGKSFSATQNIVVGNDSGGGSTATSTDSSNSSGSNSSSSSSGGTSSHSSQTSLSDVKESLEFKVSAGRKRLASTNVPVEFSAVVSGDESPRNSGYLWSFGDGGSAIGKSVSHIYKFPGKYNVVINIEGRDQKAVSRTEVEVIEPRIDIKGVGFGQNGFVEILNNSDSEINLGEFSVGEASPTQVFAKDTIVKAKSIIRFPLSLAETDTIVLFYPNKNVVTSYGVGITATNPEREKMISEIKNSLTYLQNELLIARAQASGVGGEGNTYESDSNISDSSQITTVSSIEKDDQTALIQALDNHKENQGIFSKSMKFIKGLFGQ